MRRSKTPTLFACALIATLAPAVRAGQVTLTQPVITPWSLGHRDAELFRSPDGWLFITVAGAIIGRNSKTQRVSTDLVPSWPLSGKDSEPIPSFGFSATEFDGAGGMFKGSLQSASPSAAVLFHYLADGSNQAYGPPYFDALRLSPSANAQSIDIARADEDELYAAFVEGVATVRLQRRRHDGSTSPGWNPVGMAMGGGGYFADLLSDGSGGCLVLTGYQMMLHRILADSTRAPGFPPNGVTLSQAAFGGRSWLFPSGASHVIALWQEAAVPERVIAVRVGVDGVLDPTWPIGGQVLVPAVSDTPRAVTVLPDGEGGMHVAWLSGTQPRWTRWTSAGQPAPGHSVAGIALAGTGADAHVQAGHFTTRLVIAARPGGGLMFAGHRQGGGSRLRWFQPDGSLDPSEPDSGCVVPLYPLALLDDGAGGAYLAHSYFDNTLSEAGVLMSRVVANAVLESPLPPRQSSLRFDAPVPNPARAAVSFQFSLPGDEGATLTLHDLAGRQVRVARIHGSGRQSVRFEDLSDLPPGLYLAHLAHASAVRTTRLVLTR